VSSEQRPPPSSEAALARMKRQARRDTRPEMLVRKALHAAGLRYRLQQPVPGNRRRTIDISFPRLKIAVFLDGCFWHGCPLHATRPKANATWWSEKVAANQCRDADTNALLHAAGWHVLRFWEHEDSLNIATAIEAALAERGRAPR
jgi:DNA mismatch endonuclease, patch repair protein